MKRARTQQMLLLVSELAQALVPVQAQVLMHRPASLTRQRRVMLHRRRRSASAVWLAA